MGDWLFIWCNQDKVFDDDGETMLGLQNKWFQLSNFWHVLQQNGRLHLTTYIARAFTYSFVIILKF